MLATCLALALAPTPAADEQLTVLGPDGDPVAGAEVRLLESSALIGLFFGVAGDGGREELWRELEVATTSGDDGSAWFGDVEPGTTVIVSTDELYGSCTYGMPGGDPDVVRLAPAPVVEVQVVDAAGVGVPDALVAIAAWKGGAMITLVPAGRTDESGRSDALHFLPWFAGIEPDGWSIALPEVVAMEAPGATYQPDSPETLSVALELPAFGSMRVRFVDEARQPVEVEGGVLASAVGAATPLAWPVWSRGTEVLLRHVELGREVELQVMSMRQMLASEVVAGPTRADVDVAVDVVVEAEPTALPESYEVVVRGRVLDAVGAPLARAPVDVTLSSGDMASSYSSSFSGMSTDREGRFQYVVESDRVFASLPVEVHVRRDLRGGDSFTAEATIASLPSTHVVELGDLELRPSPRVVAGRVVDVEGAPLAGARVELSTVPLAGSGWGTEGQNTREVVQGLDVRTDAEGRFEIRGPWRGASLEWGGVPSVRAQLPKLGATAWVIFELGAEDVVVPFVASAPVEGRVALDERISPEWLRLELVRDGAPPAGRESGVEPERDGGFRLGPAPLGTSHLYVWLDGPGVPRHIELDPVRVIESIEVGGGPDPRLAPLDLRGTVHLYELTLRLPDATSVERATCSLRVEKRGGPVWQPVSEPILLDWRVRRFVSTERPLEVRVDAPGMRARIVELGSVQQEVQLEPGLPVRVELTNPPELPPGARLVVSVSPVGNVGVGEVDVELDERGMGTTGLAEPGTYLVSRVQPVATNGSIAWSGSAVFLSRESAPTFEVVESDAEQFLRFTLSATDVEKLETEAKRMAGSR